MIGQPNCFSVEGFDNLKKPLHSLNFIQEVISVIKRRRLTYSDLNFTNASLLEDEVCIHMPKFGQPILKSDQSKGRMPINVFQHL